MDVGAWLRDLGLGRYERAFLDNDIDPDLLPGLTADDLKELGVASLGHRRRILAAIAALRADDGPPDAAAATTPVGQPGRTAVSDGAERRQLTVMFVDLVGSTELSGRLDPEEMRELIRGYQNAVAGEVARFGGHLAQYLGDGALAYFGWPRAHEAAAERAARAGLAVAAAVAGLEGPDGAPLAARVGIATGPVVVGDLLVTGEAQVRAAVGETLNLAARLQGFAEPGAVVISMGTRRLLGGLFAYRDLGPATLKGFAGPVAAYQLLGEGVDEGRFEALHGGVGLTPLVGRGRELEFLLERWRCARESRGQVVLLSGEAGIGKSRLVRVLRERLAAAEPHHTPLALFCSPHHANTALHPAVGLLDRAAGSRRDDPPAERLDKLEAMLALATDGDPRGIAAPLADLLAIPVPHGRYPALDLSPPQRRERIFLALLDQLSGLAARRPVLVIYEDVHWADPTTLELLARTVERVRDLPALVVVTFRPEFVAPWADAHRHEAEGGHVTALPLGRLGRRQGGAMVGRVAGGKALPPEVLERILARTDGVPLFVEELTKSVLESGLLRDEGDRYTLDGPLPRLAIPATLQDSLMARLDRLAPVKEVAQVAAVIGREFPGNLLAAVVARGGDELHDALDRLVAAGLVFRRGEPPGGGGGHATTYAFKHALVRDAAYQSLLRGRRRQLHARVAQVIEDRFPEAAAAEPELLARHCARAGFPERAARHWLRAAQLAVGRSANLEALAHCGDAEAQLRALPGSAAAGRARIELDVQLLRGIAARAGMGYAAPEAERAFSRACEICEELGDRVRLVQALRGVFGFYYVAGRWEDAARVADRIGAAAEGLDDPTALMLRWFAAGASVLFRGRPVEAAPRLEEALRHHDRGDREAHLRQLGVDMGALIRTHLALARWLTGSPERAASAGAEALATARTGANPFTLAQMLANVALLRLLAGEWDAVEGLAAETREVASRHGMADYVAFGGVLAGVAVAMRGDAARGASLAGEGLAGLRRTGWRCVVPILLAQLASAASAAGDDAAAVATATEALRAAREGGELCWEAEALRVLGLAKRAAGAAPGDVEADLEAALAVAREQGALAFELRAAASLARLWADSGEQGRARDLLAPVYDRFSEGFGTADLRRARALLDALA